MKHVGIFEAKTHLSNLIDEVEKGREVVHPSRAVRDGRRAKSSEPRSSSQPGTAKLKRHARAADGWISIDGHDGRMARLKAALLSISMPRGRRRGSRAPLGYRAMPSRSNSRDLGALSDVQSSPSSDEDSIADFHAIMARLDSSRSAFACPPHR